MALRKVAVISAVASVTGFVPRAPRTFATAPRHAAEADEEPAFPPLADAEVVILHRSRSSLAAVAYELASSLRELEGVGVGVATDGDGADAKALQALKCVRTLTPADGMSGYDEALTSLFAQGDSTRRKILVDASSLTADAAAERAQTAKSLKVDALCIIGDALTADDGSGKRGELSNKDEALAPGLETAARNHFPGGTSVVRCELVLGARGCDEAFQYRNHPLAYFFERFARNRMAPIPGVPRRPFLSCCGDGVIVERTTARHHGDHTGPGPRAGGPPMLVGAARAADVARLVEAVVASDTPLGVVTAGPVRPHDLGPATYAQLARAAAFACGVERARLPLYAPGNGWRERVGFPLADAPRHLDASTTAAAFEHLPEVPDARRDAAVVASTPPKRYGAKKLTFNAEAAALSTAEHVLFAAVGDCYENLALWHLKHSKDAAAAKAAAKKSQDYYPGGRRPGARRHLREAERLLQGK